MSALLLTESVVRRRQINRHLYELGVRRRELVTSIELLTYDGTLEGLDDLEARRTPLVADIATIDHHIESLVRLNQLYWAQEQHERALKIEAALAATIAERERAKLKRVEQRLVDQVSKGPESQERPDLVEVVRFSSLRSEPVDVRLPVPVVVAYVSPTHSHVLVDEANRRSAAMLRYAPWARRAGMFRSRRYECFAYGGYS